MSVLDAVGPSAEKAMWKFVGCKHRDGSYCRKIRHEISSGCGMLAHCYKCREWEDAKQERGALKQQ